MDTPLIKYHTWLFINGRQVGDNLTFADWYADDATAMEDARSYFTAEGYAVDSIQAEEREVRAASPLAPALLGRVLIVRLSTTSKPS